MNRSEFVARAMAKGFGQSDDTGKKLPPPASAKIELRDELISYFTNNTNGQAAWAKRPIVSGEGVADFSTIEAMVDALLQEVDGL